MMEYSNVKKPPNRERKEPDRYGFPNNNAANVPVPPSPTEEKGPVLSTQSASREVHGGVDYTPGAIPHVFKNAHILETQQQAFTEEPQQPNIVVPEQDSGFGTFPKVIGVPDIDVMYDQNWNDINGKMVDGLVADPFSENIAAAPANWESMMEMPTIHERIVKTESNAFDPVSFMNTNEHASYVRPEPADVVQREVDGAYESETMKVKLETTKMKIESMEQGDDQLFGTMPTPPVLPKEEPAEVVPIVDADEYHAEIETVGDVSSVGHEGDGDGIDTTSSHVMLDSRGNSEDVGRAPVCKSEIVPGSQEESVKTERMEDFYTPMGPETEIKGDDSMKGIRKKALDMVNVMASSIGMNQMLEKINETGFDLASITGHPEASENGTGPPDGNGDQSPGIPVPESVLKEKWCNKPLECRDCKFHRKLSPHDTYVISQTAPFFVCDMTNEATCFNHHADACTVNQEVLREIISTEAAGLRWERIPQNVTSKWKDYDLHMKKLIQAAKDKIPPVGQIPEWLGFFAKQGDMVSCGRHVTNFVLRILYHTGVAQVHFSTDDALHSFCASTEIAQQSGVPGAKPLPDKRIRCENGFFQDEALEYALNTCTGGKVSLIAIKRDGDEHCNPSGEYLPMGEPRHEVCHVYIISESQTHFTMVYYQPNGDPKASEGWKWVDSCEGITPFPSWGDVRRYLLGSSREVLKVVAEPGSRLIDRFNRVIPGPAKGQPAFRFGFTTKTPEKKDSTENPKVDEDAIDMSKLPPCPSHDPPPSPPSSPVSDGFSTVPSLPSSPKSPKSIPSPPRPTTPPPATVPPSRVPSPKFKRGFDFDHDTNDPYLRNIQMMNMAMFQQMQHMIKMQQDRIDDSAKLAADTAERTAKAISEGLSKVKFEPEIKITGNPSGNSSSNTGGEASGAKERLEEGIYGMGSDKPAFTKFKAASMNNPLMKLKTMQVWMTKIKEELHNLWPTANGKFGDTFFAWAKSGYMREFEGEKQYNVVKDIIDVSYPAFWKGLTIKQQNFIHRVIGPLRQILSEEVRAIVASQYLPESEDDQDDPNAPSNKTPQLLRFIVELTVHISKYGVQPNEEYTQLAAQLGKCYIDCGATEPDASGQIAFWQRDLRSMLALKMPKHIKDYERLKTVSAACVHLKIQLVEVLPNHLSQTIMTWWFKHDLETVSYNQPFEFWQATLSMLIDMTRHFMRYVTNHPKQRPKPRPNKKNGEKCYHHHEGPGGPSDKGATAKAFVGTGGEPDSVSYETQQQIHSDNAAAVAAAAATRQAEAESRQAATALKAATKARKAEETKALAAKRKLEEDEQKANAVKGGGKGGERLPDAEFQKMLNEKYPHSKVAKIPLELVSMVIGPRGDVIRTLCKKHNVDLRLPPKKDGKAKNELTVRAATDAAVQSFIKYLNNQLIPHWKDIAKKRANGEEVPPPTELPEPKSKQKTGANAYVVKPEVQGNGNVGGAAPKTANQWVDNLANLLPDMQKDPTAMRHLGEQIIFAADPKNAVTQFKGKFLMAKRTVHPDSHQHQSNETGVMSSQHSPISSAGGSSADAATAQTKPSSEYTMPTNMQAMHNGIVFDYTEDEEEVMANMDECACISYRQQKAEFLVNEQDGAQNASSPGNVGYRDPLSLPRILPIHQCINCPLMVCFGWDRNGEITCHKCILAEMQRNDWELPKESVTAYEDLVARYTEGKGDRFFMPRMWDGLGPRGVKPQVGSFTSLMHSVSLDAMPRSELKKVIAHCEGRLDINDSSLVYFKEAMKKLQAHESFSQSQRSIETAAANRDLHMQERNRQWAQQQDVIDRLLRNHESWKDAPKPTKRALMLRVSRGRSSTSRSEAASLSSRRGTSQFHTREASPERTTGSMPRSASLGRNTNVSFTNANGDRSPSADGTVDMPYNMNHAGELTSHMLDNDEFHHIWGSHHIWRNIPSKDDIDAFDSYLGKTYDDRMFKVTRPIYTSQLPNEVPLYAGGDWHDNRIIATYMGPERVMAWLKNQLVEDGDMPDDSHTIHEVRLIVSQAMQKYAYALTENFCIRYVDLDHGSYARYHMGVYPDATYFQRDTVHSDKIPGASAEKRGLVLRAIIKEVTDHWTEQSTFGPVRAPQFAFVVEQYIADILTGESGTRRLKVIEDQYKVKVFFQRQSTALCTNPFAVTGVRVQCNSVEHCNTMQFVFERNIIPMILQHGAKLGVVPHSQYFIPAVATLISRRVYPVKIGISIPARYIPQIIGPRGMRVSAFEKKYQVHIRVERIGNADEATEQRCETIYVNGPTLEHVERFIEDLCQQCLKLFDRGEPLTMPAIATMARWHPELRLMSPVRFLEMSKSRLTKAYIESDTYKNFDGTIRCAHYVCQGKPMRLEFNTPRMAKFLQSIWSKTSGIGSSPQPTKAKKGTSAANRIFTAKAAKTAKTAKMNTQSASAPSMSSGTINNEGGGGIFTNGPLKITAPTTAGQFMQMFDVSNMSADECRKLGELIIFAADPKNTHADVRSFMARRSPIKAMDEEAPSSDELFEIDTQPVIQMPVPKKRYAHPKPVTIMTEHQIHEMQWGLVHADGDNNIGFFRRHYPRYKSIIDDLIESLPSGLSKSGHKFQLHNFMTWKWDNRSNMTATPVLIANHKGEAWFWDRNEATSDANADWHRLPSYQPGVPIVDGRPSVADILLFYDDRPSTVIGIKAQERFSREYDLESGTRAKKAFLKKSHNMDRATFSAAS